MYKLIFILFFSFNAVATNIEYLGGNITYKHLFGTCSGVPYFEVTINLFTKTTKTAGDSIRVQFGDGIEGFVKRTDSVDIGNNVTKSIYKKIHAYGSCGYYEIVYIDTINIQSVKNISPLNSIFYISTQLVLNSFYAPISSYTTFCNPATKIFKNKPFTFNNTISTNNTLTYDSIIHSLFSISINPTYSMYIPNGVKINRYSGEIQWMNPDTLGNYVFMPITQMYKDGNMVSSSSEYYKFEVINHNPTYIYDSIYKVPLNIDNFKEIIYTVGNTYSFTSVYTDPVADSVKTFAYPIDFFTTAPIVNITKNTIKKNTLSFTWSPVNADDRLYPYNFVLNSHSYYGIDSVANTYQTVSLKSFILNSVKDNMNELSDLKIYPNPTTSVLNITNEQVLLQKATIIITNTLGQALLSFPFSNQIDVSTLSFGVYFIKIKTTNNKFYYAKFIKE